ncbi:MAG: hypothetical protein ACK5Q5_24220 [Planctomycetaceae bacterium]
MRYTVTWHDDVVAQLAEHWLASRDRDGLSVAVAAIDRRLRFSPRSHARPVGDRLGVTTVHPVEVLFEVVDEDRLVKVVAVRLIGSPSK